MKTLSISTETLGNPLNANTYLPLTGNFPNPFTNAPNGPVKIVAIEGYCNGAAGTQYWLQILNGAPGATVPMYSVQVLGGQGFSFIYPLGLDTATMQDGGGASLGENVYKPYLAISSTDGLYTSVAATTNVRVDIEMQFQMPLGLITANGNNTGSLTVFADPNATNKLCAFSVVNNTGAVGYLMLFAYANPVNGATPLQQWPVQNGGTFATTFGNAGVRFQQGKADYSIHTGCYLVASSTTQTLTTVANGWNMFAWLNPV